MEKVTTPRSLILTHKMATATETHPMSVAELQSLAILNETESQYNSRVKAEDARAMLDEKYAREKAERDARRPAKIEHIYQTYIPKCKQKLIQDAQRGELIISVELPGMEMDIVEEVVNNWFLREPEWRMPMYTYNPLQTNPFEGYRRHDLWFDLRVQHEIKPIK